MKLVLCSGGCSRGGFCDRGTLRPRIRPYQGNGLDHVMIVLALKTGPGGGEFGGAIVALDIHGVVSDWRLPEGFTALGRGPC